MRYIKFNKMGVTLVELMVVLAILTFVLTLIYGIFISQIRSKTWQDELSEVQQNVRGAVDLIQMDIIKSDAIANAMSGAGCGVQWIPSILFSNTSMILIGDFDNNGTKDWASYYLDTDTDRDNGKGTEPYILWRETGSFDPGDTSYTIVQQFPTHAKEACAAGTPYATPTVVAENISSFIANYVTNENYVIADNDLNAKSIKDTRSVEFIITGQTAKPNPNLNPLDPNSKFKKSMKGRVELRNSWRYTGSGCGVLSFTMDRSTVAFCDPPGEVVELRIRTCDLEGNAVSSVVQIFPKIPKPINIYGPNVTQIANVATLTISPAAGTKCDDAGALGYAYVNTPSASQIEVNQGIDMLAKWRPTVPDICSYSLVSGKSVVVQAGKAWGFDDSATLVTPSIINACQDGSQATFEVKVVDKCTHAIDGRTVTSSIVGDPGDGTKGTIGNFVGLGSSTGKYFATFYNGTTAQAVTLKASTMVYNGADPNVEQPTTTTATITQNPGAPFDLEAVSSPFSISTQECPSRHIGLTYKIDDKCNNLITASQIANLTANLSDPGEGSLTIYSDPFVTGQYIVNHTTPSACGDGGTATITLSHGQTADTLTAPVTLSQCPMPGVTVKDNSPSPFQLPACDCNLSDPNTYEEIVGELRAEDSCSPWAGYYADYTFDVENTTGGSSYNAGFESGGTSTITNSSSGTATVRLCGKSTTTAPLVGDKLNVKVKAKIRYSEAGPVGIEYPIAPDTADLGVNLIEVVSPPVTMRFMDSGYANAVTAHAIDCSIDTDLYMEIRDCDAGSSIDATLTSIDENGATRDSEAITINKNAQGFYTKSFPTSTTAGGIDSGKLKVYNYDTIKLSYTDASTSTVQNTTVMASGYTDTFIDGSSGWTLGASAPSPSLWHIANSTATSGDKVYVYNKGSGTATSGTFYTGSQTYGSLISPSFLLKSTTNESLVFTSAVEKEAPTSYDKRYVCISKDDGVTWTQLEPNRGLGVACPSDSSTTTDSLGVENTRNIKHPHRVNVSLSSLPAVDWDSKTVKLKFHFNSIDSAVNAYRGWYIDDVFLGCKNLIDTTAPAAPAIDLNQSSTLAANKVRLVWDAVASAEGYSVFVYKYIPYVSASIPSFSNSTDPPYDVVQDITENCTVVGKVCYEYTSSSANLLLSDIVKFKVAAFDSSGNISTLSGAYADRSDVTPATPTFTCYQKVNSGSVGKNKIIVKGNVKTIDGANISGATVNFSAQGDTSLSVDTWGLISEDPSGNFCGDNESAPINPTNPSPFTTTDNLINTSAFAVSGAYTGQSTTFPGESACSCP